MTRLERPGGAVAAYAWDILGGGFHWSRSALSCARWGLSQ